MNEEAPMAMPEEATMPSSEVVTQAPKHEPS